MKFIWHLCSNEMFTRVCGMWHNEVNYHLLHIVRECVVFTDIILFYIVTCNSTISAWFSGIEGKSIKYMKLQGIISRNSVANWFRLLHIHKHTLKLTTGSDFLFPILICYLTTIFSIILCMAFKVIVCSVISLFITIRNAYLTVNIATIIFPAWQ